MGTTSELDSAVRPHVANFTDMGTFACSSSYSAFEEWTPHALSYPEVEQLDHSTAGQGSSQQEFY